MKNFRQNLCCDKEVLCRDHKSYKMIEFYWDRRRVARDKNLKRTEISQVKSVATRISISQQTAQPAIRTREEKSVVTTENSITIEIKESKKSCRDIENSIVIE